MRAEVMASGFPAVPTDGVSSVQTRDASASVLRWAVVERDRLAGPRSDESTGSLFAGDVRLYNRVELAQALGDVVPSDERSDLDLAYLAYRKWGTDAPRRLIGDFAFVAWDGERKSIFAARDHLGVRPLYYLRLGDGLLIASHVRQLLPFIPRPFESVNPHRILERFIGPSRKAGQTYFENVSLLRPGHCLLASPEGHREQRYWFPPKLESAARSYRENCDELRRLFRRAVRDRLESDFPLLAHSSGGFDSSTILMAAEDVYANQPGRPPLIMASATAHGFPCDESGYMDAVAAHVRFEGIRWSAVDPAAMPPSRSSLAYPGFSCGPGGGPRADIELARGRQARALIGGTGGDDVLFAGGIFLDLCARGRWRDLFRETVVRRKPLSRGARTLARAMLGRFPPTAALQIGRRVFARPGRPPLWLGDRLRAIYPPEYPAIEGLDHDWPSHTQFELWSRITGPEFGRGLGGMVQYGSEYGLEIRLPFTDVRLFEHLLSIPWNQRIPLGHPRRTGREALGPLLPPVFAGRTGQKPWTPVWARNAKAARPLIAKMLETGPWLSEPFVVRSRARQLLREIIDRPNRETGWPRLLDFAALESWLRQLICYNPAREEDACPLD
jgi:asparagine synthase (glutamine-hydrolysing)